MFNQEMIQLGTQRSVIREIFEFGNQRAAQVGRDNVFDFSIGNPNVPAPPAIKAAIEDIIERESPVAYHSYTSSAGSQSAREAIAKNLNTRYGTDYEADDLYLTCGAAASLNITLQSLIRSEEDEILTVAPFFPEYRFFVTARGGRFVVVPADLESFQIDFEGLRQALTPHTKALIINSPNNPSGVVYSKQTYEQLAEILREKAQEYGHPIYLISDEPYRELVYGGETAHFVPNFYENTIVNYSWSKSLSLPGERIGYILIPKKLQGAKDLMAAVFGSARILGFVCAPSLFQQVIERCVDVQPDLRIYEANRNLLWNRLRQMGYRMAKPDGAFYAFIESPSGSGEEFCERAKKYDLLLVPGTGFGVPSHMRLSYCVKTETIEKCLPLFEKLMAEYRAEGIVE
ncbi:Biosynthetic Aromatic amino acid aminotransferase alpha [Clostridiaceae bacterium JG1575]|nr:Biosynthetic Aromatic amino acid aminotransferase alpha [Clostridiaceae bacterium JG1575]